MFTWLAKKSQPNAKARELYGAVVAQARTPAFYRTLGVADTPEGRYELIALHLVLTLDRLDADIADEMLQRETMEAFVADMDGAMRQMGIGDAGMSRHVKKAAGGVHARSFVYRAALAQAGDAALETALAEHVYHRRSGPSASPLTLYVRAAVDHLAALPASDLRAGKISFPHVPGEPGGHA